MYHSEGVGLAAPQVGINKRILVLNPVGHPKKKRSEKVMINPVILKHSDDLVSINEGCLSFPTIYADIPRYQWVEVLYQNIHGEKHVSKFKDFDSILVQHEMDHLEQVRFIFSCLLLLTSYNIIILIIRFYLSINLKQKINILIKNY